MVTELQKAEEAWLKANNSAVDVASKCITKKGAFNPPLEKPWPEWERLREIADGKWYAYRAALLKSFEDSNKNK